MHDAFGAEFREVVERDYEGALSRVVVAVKTYATSPSDLWDALTNPQRIPRWFLPIEGDLKLGGRYQLKGNAGGTIRRCEAPDHQGAGGALDVTWEFMGGMSWVTVRLAPEGGATRLTLEHIVHKSDADEHWAKFGPAAVGVGWDLTLMGLGRHLASGETLSHEAAEAWMRSDDGKALMRASAAAWAEAHIKGGEDPDTARGMAERTAGFYTGG
jgi:uncharacterized protein YndB with AHSA1/START domain